MEPSDVIHSIKLKTGDIGASFYFHPDTLARGKEIGLDGFRFYALGRGGVLGDVEPGVVHSAFGYFQPDLIVKIWNSAKEIMAPRDAAREYIACGHALGRAKCATIPDLDGYVEAATALIAAADGSAMSLFAGLRAEPVPNDVAAAAFHQAMVLREMRGGAHLVAIVAAGLSAPVAHAIKRPDDVGMFGYREPPMVTDDDRAAHVRAEEITDQIETTVYSVLTDAQAAALVAGTDAMHTALTGG